MKTSNNKAIEPKMLSKSDWEMITRLFTWIKPPEKVSLSEKHGVSLSHVNMVLAGTRHNKAIFSEAIGIAIKNKKAHQEEFKKIASNV